MCGSTKRPCSSMSFAMRVSLARMSSGKASTSVTWDGLVEPSHVAKTYSGSTLYSAGVSQNSLHLFGKAKATISSFVTSEPVRLPPVLTTVTNCRPSAPIYVAGVASIDDGSLVSQSC